MPHDHTNPLLTPVFPGFQVKTWLGFALPVVTCNFQRCKSPPQPVSVVDGDYIDRRITDGTTEKISKRPVSRVIAGEPEVTLHVNNKIVQVEVQVCLNVVCLNVCNCVFSLFSNVVAS